MKTRVEPLHFRTIISSRWCLPGPIRYWRKVGLQYYFEQVHMTPKLPTWRHMRGGGGRMYPSDNSVRVAAFSGFRQSTTAEPAEPHSLHHGPRPRNNSTVWCESGKTPPGFCTFQHRDVNRKTSAASGSSTFRHIQAARTGSRE